MDKKTMKEKCKKAGLVAVATAGTACTVGLGILCYMKTKEIEQLKIDKKDLRKGLDIFKDAYEDLVYRVEEKAETADLVKNVVGGPLIERLIKNEERVLNRLMNKKDNILKRGLDEAAKKTVEDLDIRIQNSLDTIKDFVDVKNVLE